MWNKYLASLFVLLIYCQLTNAQEVLKAPVVKIHAFLPGALDEIGAGIITGERDEVLYILTALHVIEPGLEGGTIEVSLRGRSAVTAEMVQSNSSYDLALIGIRKPMGFSAVGSFLPAGELPPRESFVTLVGHPQGSEWDINSRAQLKATQLDLSNDFFTLYPEQVKNGHSGGPVLNQEKELIGMVLETSGVRARCLNISFLKRACEFWNIPVDYMTGIIDEGPVINNDPNDFRYNLLVRRGNQAFEAGQWQTAKDAFSDANNLRSSQTLRDRMADCDTELGKDREYNRLLRLGLDPNNSLAESLSYFKQAARQRNTSEVKNYLRQTEQALQDLASVEQTPAATSRSSYTDRYAGDMVWVEGGSFMMGSNEGDDDEKPVHRVNLDGFWMGKYEVTNEQFCVFLNEKGNQTEGGTTWLEIESSFCDITQSSSRFLPKSGKNNHPVCKVSWYGAKAYAAWVATKTGHSYLLPTEAQWEYAARGGSSNRTKWAGTESESSLGDYAWYSSNSNSTTHPVGEKRSNHLGLYDMSGNLLEWCADWFGGDYYTNSPSNNPTGPNSGTSRVLRGGGWSVAPQDLRVAYRAGNSPYSRSSYLGFRLSRTL